MTGWTGGVGEGSLTAGRFSMPEREWVLLNPGPANTSRSVREALVMPDLCHREPEFFEMMRECRERLVRLADCAERFAAVLFTGSGTATVVDPADVETALRARPELSHVAVVHHETTTGLLNPVMDIARVAARTGRRVLIDAMSSLFGERLDVDADGVDFVMASANKCLQGVPGIAFVLGRRSALEALAADPPRSVYLDLHS